MRYIVLFFSLLTPLSYAASQLESTIAHTLASYGIIVDNEKNPENYRLTDTITRAETIGVALRVGNINLPEEYFCRNYYRDVSYSPLNNWICRAIEIAADNNIITRENVVARPSDAISRIEALAVIMKAGKISYVRNREKTNYPKNMPQWQVDVLRGALEYKIISSIERFGPDMVANRIDVFGMIYNMRFSGTKMEYDTDTLFPPPSSTSGPTITLPQNNTTIIPSTSARGELAGFSVTAPKDIGVNKPFDIVIQALGSDNKTLTDYTGTIYLDLFTGSSTDMSPLITEDGYSFTQENKGIIILRNIILKKSGKYEIDVYEIESNFDLVKTFTISATDAILSPSVELSSFLITAPGQVTAFTSFDMTVSALNSAGEVMTNYVGTVYFTTSTGTNSSVEFPQGKYTFTDLDKGKHTFSGVKLKQPGTYDILVYEVAIIPDGTKKTVTITAKAPN